MRRFSTALRKGPETAWRSTLTSSPQNPSLRWWTRRPTGSATAASMKTRPPSFAAGKPCPDSFTRPPVVSLAAALPCARPGSCGRPLVAAPRTTSRLPHRRKLRNYCVSCCKADQHLQPNSTRCSVWRLKRVRRGSDRHKWRYGQPGEYTYCQGAPQQATCREQVRGCLKDGQQQVQADSKDLKLVHRQVFGRVLSCASPAREPAYPTRSLRQITEQFSCDTPASTTKPWRGVLLQHGVFGVLAAARAARTSVQWSSQNDCTMT